MSEELTSWTGLLLLGARIPVREPWSTPSTMIRCMIAWALTEEAASARAETTDILSGYERELKEWCAGSRHHSLSSAMPSRFLLAYALRKRKQRACRGVKSKVVYTRNRFGVAKRSLKRLGPLEEHLAWRYSGLHSVLSPIERLLPRTIVECRKPPEARYAMFCVSSFEKRKRYYWHRDLCANPPASMAIYDCEIFSKVMEYTFRSFRFHRRSCLYSSRARRSARAYKLSRLLASIVMDISTVQWRKECRLGHRYGRCMCSRQFGDWRELRRPDQKRHYVTIALRRWSVTVSLSRACVGRVVSLPRSKENLDLQKSDDEERRF
ncbi:hypothetical protein KCU72_g19, partial [Aureobasidium melanogenum]